jgi:hypothetical protein
LFDLTQIDYNCRFLSPVITLFPHPLPHLRPRHCVTS